MKLILFTLITVGVQLSYGLPLEKGCQWVLSIFRRNCDYVFGPEPYMIRTSCDSVVPMAQGETKRICCNGDCICCFSKHFYYNDYASNELQSGIEEYPESETFSDESSTTELQPEIEDFLPIPKPMPDYDDSFSSAWQPQFEDKHQLIKSQESMPFFGESSTNEQPQPEFEDLQSIEILNSVLIVDEPPTSENLHSTSSIRFPYLLPFSPKIILTGIPYSGPATDE
ncbi:uncharacterized protein LOC131431993 [Malaya genurostris]|uniref:uncharacterized protein LOC131431993 n=1 Tax=Malaya genurostris TaxID=325434 RepID=UPI0026F3D7F4|nr:uncharacterized protein LOC131431993 [Malaya genurostris]